MKNNKRLCHITIATDEGQQPMYLSYSMHGIRRVLHIAVVLALFLVLVLMTLGIATYQHLRVIHAYEDQLDTQKVELMSLQQTYEALHGDFLATQKALEETDEALQKQMSEC